MDYVDALKLRRGNRIWFYKTAGDGTRTGEVFQLIVERKIPSNDKTVVAITGEIYTAEGRFLGKYLINHHDIVDDPSDIPTK